MSCITDAHKLEAVFHDIGIVAGAVHPVIDSGLRQNIAALGTGLDVFTGCGILEVGRESGKALFAVRTRMRIQCDQFVFTNIAGILHDLGGGINRFAELEAFDIGKAEDIPLIA